MRRSPGQNGKAFNLVLMSSPFETTYEASLLNQITTPGTGAPVIRGSSDKTTGRTERKPVALIPLCAGLNRGESEMRILFPQALKDNDMVTAE